jgi:phospholipid/cholesterol/gamma-HCH transport system substrate-binding protein
MEVKVGALILASLGLLIAFVVVMGGLSLKPTLRVYVDFENPGGLQSGAPVRMAGARIGRVTAIEFRGGEVDKEGRPEAPIRVVASIESDYQKALHDDARFFVTSQGVLGEMFLAVEPGTLTRPLIEDGAILRGVSPPRLDMLLSEASDLLHLAYLGINNNRQKLAETFDGLHATLQGTGRFFDKNGEKLDRIVDRLESISTQAEETLAAAREQYVDGPRAQHILQNIEHTTTSLNENLGPLLEDTRVLVADARRISQALGSDEQLAAYRGMTQDVQATLKSARQVAGRADNIMAHVEQGKGTAGALVMDEALYDDLQELVRDLKHNPWKFFWRQ